MPRTIIENGVTFRVDSEIGWTAADDANVAAADAELSYITTGETGNAIPAFLLTSPHMIFSGAVTAIDGDPAEIAKWQLGIAQNVTAYRRVATYTSGWSIAEALQTGDPSWNPAPPPLRDGEPGRIPFYVQGTTLALNQRTEIDPGHVQDAPTWDFPQAMSDGSTLVSTSGEDQLATWLMLARIVNPPEERMVILLGRIRRRVDWTTVMQGASPAFQGPVATVLELATGLAEVYKVANRPVLGDGTAVPDLRTNVAGNDYVVGILSHPDEVRAWRYNDERDAVAFAQAANPNGSPSWLAEQQFYPVQLQPLQRTDPGPSTSVQLIKPKNATASGQGTVFDVEVAANVLWSDTGLTVDEHLPVFLRPRSGSWTANPGMGMVGPTGHPELIAKPGYNLPSALEGLLVGKVGSAVFPVGSGAAVPAGATGRLYLSINDDMTGEYGAGFTDNEGSMLVEITVRSRRANVTG
jgi:hypothetical protein